MWNIEFLEGTVRYSEYANIRIAVTYFPMSSDT